MKIVVLFLFSLFFYILCSTLNILKALGWGYTLMVDRLPPIPSEGLACGSEIDRLPAFSQWRTGTCLHSRAVVQHDYILGPIPSTAKRIKPFRTLRRTNPSDRHLQWFWLTSPQGLEVTLQGLRYRGLPSLPQTVPLMSSSDIWGPPTLRLKEWTFHFLKDSWALGGEGGTEMSHLMLITHTLLFSTQWPVLNLRVYHHLLQTEASLMRIDKCTNLWV